MDKCIPFGKKRCNLKLNLGILSLVQVILIIASIRDIRKTPAPRLKGGKKWPWYIIASCFELIGPVVYFVWGKKRIV